MNHVGTILVIGESAEGSADVCHRLREHGYDARHAGSRAEALSSFAQERHEVVLLQAGSAPEALEIASALREADHRRSATIAVTPTGDGRGFDVPAALANCDDYIAPPLYDAKLLAHLRPLVRLATIRTEVAIRLSVARTFGVEIALDENGLVRDEPIRALAVGSLSRIRPALAGVEFQTVDDPLFAIDALHKNPFDLAVIAADENTVEALDLCLRIRSSPSLFNLPVLFIGNAGGTDEVAAYDHGASAHIDAGSDERPILARASAQVRRHNIRRALNRALAATLTDRTRDTWRAYSSAFLSAYLPERIRFAQKYGRHLTLVSVHTADVEKARRQYGAVQAADMRGALSEWIAQLTRVEDLVAARGEQEFVVALPDTPRWEAAQVTARLAAIIGQVEFALTEVYEAVRVSVGISGAALRPGETLGELIARARSEQI